MQHLYNEQQSLQAGQLFARRMLFLLGLTVVAARRQRDTSGGRLKAPQAATVGGKVGGDVCPLQVCSAAEDRSNCSLVRRSGEERRACGRLHMDNTQLYVEGAQAQVLRHKCSVCGVSPTVHMLEPTPNSNTGGGGAAAYPYPPFPPRTTPTFCAVAGDAEEGEHWPRVSTVEESMLRRDQAIQWLRSQACQCNCTVAGGGESMNLVSRLFPKGISHVHGLCGPHGRRLDVTLQTDKSTGGIDG